MKNPNLDSNLKPLFPVLLYSIRLSGIVWRCIAKTKCIVFKYLQNTEKGSDITVDISLKIRYYIDSKRTLVRYIKER